MRYVSGKEWGNTIAYKKLLNIEAGITFSLLVLIIALLLFLGFRLIQLKELQLMTHQVEKNMLNLNYHTRSILLETGYTMNEMKTRLESDVSKFDSSLLELIKEYQRIFPLKEVPESLNLALRLWKTNKQDYLKISRLLRSLIDSGFSKRFFETTGVLRYNVYIPQRELHLNLDHSYLLKIENEIESLIAVGSAYEQLLLELAILITSNVHFYSRATIIIAGALISLVILTIILYTIFFSHQRLIREIDRLFAAGVQKERAIRTAQIEAIRYQINPHFLYNTLTSISFVAKEEESPTTVALLRSLSELFQETLSNTSSTLSLAEEISIDQHYLDMLQLRYNNSLTIKWNILVDPTTFYLLPTLVQPLIENAVMHGLGPVINNREKALVTITAEVEHPFLIVSVEDNGIGFDKNPLDISYRRENVGGHIGLENVRNRIQRHYGNQYTLKINKLNPGSKVSLYLPVLNERVPL